MTSFKQGVRSIFRLSALAVICSLPVQCFAVCSQGGQTATYQFVGQCTDCTGTGVGQLTLQNYTLGAALTFCNLVSFTYTSNLTSFTVTPANLTNLSGTLPSPLPSTANVEITFNGNNQVFSSNTNGSWTVGATDYGPTSTWSLPAVTPVSAPVLGVPMFIGLTLLLVALAASLLKTRSKPNPTA